MIREPELQLLIEAQSEVARWRRRALFLFSVVAHGIFIILILIAPQLFRRGAAWMGIPLHPERKRDTTFLVMPPDLQRVKEPPPTDNFSDKNRRAQGRSPLSEPDGLRMPYSPGNTPLPEIAGGGQPTPPPTPPSAPPSESTQPSRGASPPEATKKDEGLRLNDVTAGEPAEGQQSRLRLPTSTPGEAIQQSLQAAVRGRNGGPAAGPGDSAAQFQNFHPNFSTEAPIILSDTRGVDFGPYLARLVYTVRRNWYQVIPESARLGEKGRVAIVFEILKDGSVPEIRLVGSSGSDALDRAALAGIRASIPFAPLPSEFTGNNLVLQFIFLYNVGYGP